jgi:hypothetical protein
MIKSRLLLLAARLDKIEALPKPKRTREFNLSVWVRSGECGSAACAVGEATFIKRFRDLGLRFSKRLNYPTFKGRISWDAVSKFFGITHHQAISLFTSGGFERRGVYATGTSIRPGQVADAIRKLVETGSI